MALLLNGTTQYAYKDSTFSLTAAPLTFSFWAKIATAADAGTVLCITDSVHDNDWFRANVNSAGTVGIDVNGSAFSGISTTATVTTGAWFHVVGVFASTTSRSIYLNGGNKRTDTTLAIPTALNLNRTALGVLARASITGYFKGQVSDVAIYNVALSDAEVSQLATPIKGMPLFIQSAALKVYLPCNDVSDGSVPTTIIDLSGNGDTLNTVVNSPTIQGESGIVWPLSPTFVTRSGTVAAGGSTQGIMTTRSGWWGDL